MEMFLMIMCMSVFSLAVTALAFGAATRPEKKEEVVPVEAKPVLAASEAQFFVAPPPQVRPVVVPIPVEALLLQIERHIRLEHAAAESFVEDPTAALLHSRTSSPLVH